MTYFFNKVAVVTGAGSGIGRALAVQLAEQGCHLAISDIDEKSLAVTVSQLPKRDQIKVHSAPLNVADRQAFADYAKAVINEFGQVDLVINNAGVASRDKLMADYDYAEYERVMDVNLWGVIHGTHEFLPHLIANPGSHLVNISSIFGLITAPRVGVYCLTKYAVRGYTEALRTELASQNVKVTCVHPGVIATNIAAAAGAGTDVVDSFAKHGMTPEKTAARILRAAEKGKARVLITGFAYYLDLAQRLFPAGYRRLIMPLLGKNLAGESELLNQKA